MSFHSPWHSPPFRICTDQSEAQTLNPWIHKILSSLYRKQFFLIRHSILPSDVRKMGCTRSGGSRLCTDRSEAQTLNPWIHKILSSLYRKQFFLIRHSILPSDVRKMGCTRSGGSRLCTDRSEAETLNLGSRDASASEKEKTQTFSRLSLSFSQCGRWDLNPHVVANTRSLV